MAYRGRNICDLIVQQPGFEALETQEIRTPKRHQRTSIVVQRKDYGIHLQTVWFWGKRAVGAWEYSKTNVLRSQAYILAV